MKRLILLIGIVLLVTSVSGSYKLDLHTLFNDYEEVCIRYQQRVVAIPQCYSLAGHFYDCKTPEIIEIGDQKPYPLYRQEYYDTDVCVEYQLVRKVEEVEPFIYDFEWCEVFPDSKDCEVLNSY